MIRSTLSPLFLMIFFVLSIPSSGQNRITWGIDDFHSLSVSGRLDVELIHSDSKEMTITALNGQPEEVKVDYADGMLKLKILTKLGNKDVINIKLPYTQLKYIHAAAGAKINSARDLVADDLNLEVITGGKIELSIEARNVTAKITQISDIILYGETESQDITVNTGGNYLAYDLACQHTVIKVSSGSQGKVRASSSLDATANAKGYIGYMGDPETISVKTSFGGEVEAVKSPGEL